MSTPPSTAQSLTCDPISLILPFLTLSEFATSAVAISQVWYTAAQTMRSRCDLLVLADFIPPATSGLVAIAPQQQPSKLPLLLSSSSLLRRHVTDLRLRFLIPMKPDTFAEKVNSVGQAMSHLKSFDINAKIDLDGFMSDEAATAAPTSELPSVHVTSVGPSSVTESPSVSFPPNLARIVLTLSFSLSFGSLGMESKKPREKWLTDLFTSIALTPSLCTSLRIIDCEILQPADFPASAVESLKALTGLRRLALMISGLRYNVDRQFMDAIRAIPTLTELKGPDLSDISYLLRQPSVQSYARIGQSALCGISGYSIREVEPDFQVNDALEPAILLVSSSRHSLTELNAMVFVPLTPILPQLTSLRVLRVGIRDPLVPTEVDGSIKDAPLPASTTTSSSMDRVQDVVYAVSQCRLIEKLDLIWLSSSFALNESHVEMMVGPLLNLDYLVLDGRHSILNLDFLTRSVHLINGLKYFSFAGRLSTLDSYRAIYSLTQLRLLHIQTTDAATLWGSLSAQGSVAGTINATALDAMFRPRHQVQTSVPLLKTSFNVARAFGGVAGGFSFGSPTSVASGFGGFGASTIEGVGSSTAGGFGPTSISTPVAGFGSGAGSFGFASPTSVVGPPNEAGIVGASTIGGQLPTEYLTHLCHFTQGHNREGVKGWKQLAQEALMAQDEEIMRQGTITTH